MLQRAGHEDIKVYSCILPLLNCYYRETLDSSRSLIKTISIILSHSMVAEIVSLQSTKDEDKAWVFI